MVVHFRATTSLEVLGHRALFSPIFAALPVPLRLDLQNAIVLPSDLRETRSGFGMSGTLPNGVGGRGRDATEAGKSRWADSFFLRGPGMLAPLMAARPAVAGRFWGRVEAIFRRRPRLLVLVADPVVAVGQVLAVSSAVAACSRARREHMEEALDVRQLIPDVTTHIYMKI